MNHTSIIIGPGLAGKFSTDKLYFEDLNFTQVDRWTVWSAGGLSCCYYILPRLIGGLFGRLVGCLAVTIFYPG